MVAPAVMKLASPASVIAHWERMWRRLGKPSAPSYGGVVFSVSTVLACISHSATIDVLGLFLPSLEAAIPHATRTSLLSFLAVGTLVNGACQPVSGRIIDRFGARIVSCVSLCIHAFGLLLLSQAAGPGALVVGFTLVRVGGISGVMLSQDSVLSKWFVRRLGSVVAWQRCVQAVFAITLIPMFVGAAVPSIGWRSTLVVLAMPLLLAVPLAVPLLLPTPECVGLKPDGEAAAPAAVGEEGAPSSSRDEEMVGLLDHMVTGSSSTAAPAEDNGAGGAPAGALPPPAVIYQFTVREALGTTAMRLMLALTACTTCTTGGITAHLSFIAADAGLDLKSLATTIIVPDAIAGVVANIVFGRFVDNGAVSLRALLSASQAMLCVAAAIGVLLEAGALKSSARDGLAVCFGLVYGGGSTAFYLFLKTATAKLFGRRHVGAIMGFINLALFCGIALGGVLYAVTRTSSGTYRPALRTSCAVMAAASLAAWTCLRPPPPPPPKDGPEEEPEEPM